MLMQTHEARLDALRKNLKRLDLAGFIVPISDEHMSEYVGEYAQRLAWLTGFTGSAGDLVVTLPTRAALLARDNAELVMLEPPFEIPEIELKMAWSPLLHHNPAHRWLRGVIAEVAQKVDA